MKKTVLMLAFAFSVAFVGCNDKKEAKEEVTTEQEATTDVTKEATAEVESINQAWELAAITTADTEGKTLDELFPNKKPALTFEGTDSVHGTDGCNNITGTYEAKENNGIAIGDKLAATRMFCEGVSDVAFNKALQSATSYEIKDGELNFIAADKVVLKFKKAEVAK
ncbi:META domain-containing protein [Myroides phaeus]|uniref:META domain-containing protein n=1 Tax=Myroides phaeus TaxID=702745 RepID=UPI001303E2C1|nr:META domain-containing protein [Myroides phaeus]